MPISIEMKIKKSITDEQTDKLDINLPIDASAIEELLTALAKQGYTHINTQNGYVTFEVYINNPSNNPL